jgi:histidine triad (HIT) family protein
VSPDDHLDAHDAHDERPDRPAHDPRAGCVFCAIVGGARAADFVLEDERAVAFLDIKPLFKGHVLVVPRAHVETLPDLPPAELAPLFGAVQRVCRAVESALDAHGTFVALNNKVSQSVPHLHVHVVPRRRKDGLRGFFWPREPYADGAERAEFAARVRAALR